MTRHTLTVRFPKDDQRSYPIHIGSSLLDELGPLLSPHLTRNSVTVITENNVEGAQGDRLRNGLTKAGIEARFITITPGESAKSFETLQYIISTLLDLGVERNDVVIAFGGGVIGDLTGFACSMIRRGCRFVQVPTTLLAQVDSSVGGKTAINVAQGKNLVGAFYQPVAVISDIDTLDTLALRDRRAGYAEIVKYGLLGNSQFFNWLDQNGSAVIENDPACVLHAVQTSCEMKAEIVMVDEREAGKRALLNLGHTFGHALEAAFGFSDRLLHGEGVCLGMMLAFEFAAQQALCSSTDVERVRAHLRATGCLTQLADMSAENTANVALNAEHLMRHMMQDKKVERGQLTLILPHAIGDAHVHRDVDVRNVHAFWKKKLNE